jgi:hypothetical protein
MSDNFKTARELRLSRREHNALVWTLGMLERGELKESPPDLRRQSGNFFYMPDVITRLSCGTAACMKGWAAIHMLGINPDPDGTYRLDAFQLVEAHTFLDKNNDALNDLFYFGGASEQHRMMDVKPHHAACALRNYLTHGKANWNEAMKAPPPKRRRGTPKICQIPAER